MKVHFHSFTKLLSHLSLPMPNVSARPQENIWWPRPTTMKPSQAQFEKTTLSGQHLDSYCLMGHLEMVEALADWSLLRHVFFLVYTWQILNLNRIYMHEYMVLTDLHEFFFWCPIAPWQESSEYSRLHAQSMSVSEKQMFSYSHERATDILAHPGPRTLLIQPTHRAHV